MLQREINSLQRASRLRRGESELAQAAAAAVAAVTAAAEAEAAASDGRQHSTSEGGAPVSGAEGALRSMLRRSARVEESTARDAVAAVGAARMAAEVEELRRSLAAAQGEAAALSGEVRGLRAELERLTDEVRRVGGRGTCIVQYTCPSTHGRMPRGMELLTDEVGAGGAFRTPCTMWDTPFPPFTHALTAMWRRACPRFVADMYGLAAVVNFGGGNSSLCSLAADE